MESLMAGCLLQESLFEVLIYLAEEHLYLQQWGHVSHIGTDDDLRIWKLSGAISCLNDETGTTIHSCLQHIAAGALCR